jgi:hypothetical protein
MSTNLRTPFTAYRAKTVPSKTRLHPGRLSQAELEDLLAEEATEPEVIPALAELCRRPRRFEVKI